MLIHVGTPKTGTSYLQDVLFRNREVLARQGILYPADRFDAHFLAALDLMRLPWGGLETEAVGAWDALAEQVRAWDGTVIISHEILATATRAQVRRAMRSLGHPDTEVHVLVSARDLVRQIPAEWQENVKHRRTIRYHAFLDQIRDPERSGAIATWFWGVQEIPDILHRWGDRLDPGRVHLVTVPHAGAAPTLLWERFVEAFGLGEVELDLHDERANPSLGAPETALLRRVNRAVNKTVPPADYRPLVRELLAHQTLSRRTRSPRLSLPPEAHAWAEELSKAWVADLGARGYDVVGDLGELLPEPGSVEFSDPDRPRERLVNRAALDAIRALVREAARLRRVESDLRAELDEAHRALERAYLRPSYKARERIVRSAEGRGAGRRLMRLYRRLRGRSSRPA
ncbi:hypothetical protein IE331_00450 [Nocardioides sp. MJB4]|uniref:Sulfotransferase family protein n=1 Tax=Nocardioides donggukensis TaxID=2774019 RepID=A0A927K290_9ACTN|nr:hypothetical protein [Nocardioides donggukensis]